MDVIGPPGIQLAFGSRFRSDSGGQHRQACLQDIYQPVCHSGRRDSGRRVGSAKPQLERWGVIIPVLRAILATLKTLLSNILSP
jgi:hypothetical protein